MKRERVLTLVLSLKRDSEVSVPKLRLRQDVARIAAQPSKTSSSDIGINESEPHCLFPISICSCPCRRLGPF